MALPPGNGKWPFVESNRNSENHGPEIIISYLVLFVSRLRVPGVCSVVPNSSPAPGQIDIPF